MQLLACASMVLASGPAVPDFPPLRHRKELSWPPNMIYSDNGVVKVRVALAHLFFFQKRKKETRLRMYIDLQPPTVSDDEVGHRTRVITLNITTLTL